MTERNFAVNAMCSASAGIISRILTHPLDTAKARLQVPDTKYKGTFDVLRRTVQYEGVTTLYRGFSAIIVGGTPGTMAYLCSYDFIKNKFLERNSSHNLKSPEFVIHLTSGMLAEAIACVIYVPVDVIKERLQVQKGTQSIGGGLQKGYYYEGSLDALKKITKNEGLGGIYKGYLATLASFGPFSALYFLFYERLKDYSRGYLQYDNVLNDRKKSELPFLYTVMCNAVAGAVASWITSPLDMAKLRLQVQRSQYAHTGSQVMQKKYDNMFGCLSHIYKENGVKGLFQGAGARVFHFVPAMTVTMTCYEKFRPYCEQLLSS